MQQRIFVIEDNEDIGFILDFFLQKEGFKVTLLKNVADFTNAFGLEVPELYLVDVMLPDGDGIGICDRIKADPRTSAIPVLMMSAHSSEIATRECHPDEFIAKPFDLNILLERIQYHLAG
jgi:DNA-binding response OmpR family regulator